MHLLHRFPANDAARRQQWLQFVEANGIDLHETTRATVLCSRHFNAEDYLGGVQRRRLTNVAVPSIVRHSMYFQQIHELK